MKPEPKEDTERNSRTRTEVTLVKGIALAVACEAISPTLNKSHAERVVPLQYEIVSEMRRNNLREHRKPKDYNAIDGRPRPDIPWEDGVSAIETGQILSPYSNSVTIKMFVYAKIIHNGNYMPVEFEAKMRFFRFSPELVSSSSSLWKLHYISVAYTNLSPKHTKLFLPVRFADEEDERHAKSRGDHGRFLREWPNVEPIIAHEEEANELYVYTLELQGGQGVRRGMRPVGETSDSPEDS